MNVFKYLLLLSVFFLFSLNSIDENPKEIIKTQLEINNLKELVVFGEKLQAIDTLSKFYQSRSFELVWNEKLASQLIFAIQQANNEGLNPNDYHLKPLIQLVLEKPKTSKEIANHDILLTDAFLSYTTHLMNGKVNPKTVDPEWYYPAKKKITVNFLDSIINNKQVHEILNIAMPQNGPYRNLRASLSNYRSMDKKEWKPIDEGQTIKKGMKDDRIPQIKERLKYLGDLRNIDSVKSTFYNDSLFIAVQHFQKRHGLEVDGKIGQQTIHTLYVNIEKRIDQIIANMERMRWMPQNLGAHFIQVNIANYELHVVRNNILLRTYKVIVGKPKRRTPLFSSTMEYTTFNPTWTVPPGIRDKDILPGIKKDPNYLSKKHITVFNHKGKVINTKRVNWNSKKVKNYIYRQSPGSHNALGMVKFMFPNQWYIYIHDTPSRHLFNKTQRAFSSGCVRINKPLEFAEYLLNDSINWNQDKINELIETEETKNVCIYDQPEVHLFYFTAWTDANHKLQFREDIYELDKPLVKKMNER